MAAAAVAYPRSHYPKTGERRRVRRPLRLDRLPLAIGNALSASGLLLARQGAPGATRPVRALSELHQVADQTEPPASSSLHLACARLHDHRLVSVQSMVFFLSPTWCLLSAGLD